MCKRVVLLLLLVSSCVYTMENNNNFFTFLDAVKSNAVALVTKKRVELLPMAALEIDKNKFEEKIQLPPPSIQEKALAWGWGESINNFLFGTKFIRYFLKQYPDEPRSPDDFLKYCYYQEYHGGMSAYNLKDLISMPNLFDSCKKVQIDGYSALGAAILAKNIPAQKRYEFLELLVRYDFEWTEKDRSLIALKFYNAIPLEVQKIMVFLLCDRPEDNLSVLPHEVRKYIAWHMVYLSAHYNWFQDFLFGLKVL